MAEYSSNGKGNLGVTLGAIGTGLGVLGSGTNLFGGMPFGMNAGYQADIEHRLADISKMAEKDMIISELKSERISDAKDIEVYKQVRTDINNALDPIRADIRELQQQNREQAVYNGVNNAAMATMRSQIDQLLSLTVVHVPAAKVCPEPMARFNSWEAPTT